MFFCCCRDSAITPSVRTSASKTRSIFTRGGKEIFAMAPLWTEKISRFGLGVSGTERASFIGKKDGSSGDFSERPRLRRGNAVLRRQLRPFRARRFVFRVRRAALAALACPTLSNRRPFGAWKCEHPYGRRWEWLRPQGAFPPKRKSLEIPAIPVEKGRFPSADFEGKRDA